VPLGVKPEHLTRKDRRLERCQRQEPTDPEPHLQCSQVAHTPTRDAQQSPKTRSRRPGSRCLHPRDTGPVLLTARQQHVDLEVARAPVPLRAAEELLGDRRVVHLVVEH